MSQRQVCFIGEPHQMQNRIFDASPSNPVNRDNGAYPFFLLKQKLNKQGIEISTSDIVSPEKADLLFFLDAPKDDSGLPKDKPSFLVITESELIKPQNWKSTEQQKHKKIFTWHDPLVDGKKYFKLNFSNKFAFTPPDLAPRPYFACLIAGEKSSQHPKELYSARLASIRWFEKNHPQDFALFGIGWDIYTFRGPRIWRILNRSVTLRKKIGKFFGKYLFPSYQGKVQSKLETMRQFTFSICYENAQQIDGYVTEKIFDSFFAGCIPVYWGAPNITQFIPADCFIDRRQFTSHEALYAFMKGLSLKDIQGYQERMADYLRSPQAAPYTAEWFAETLAQSIAEFFQGHGQ